MATKNNPGAYDCYAKAEPDEPLFIFLARSAQSAARVEDYAVNLAAMIDYGVKPESDRPKVVEALQCAAAMRAYWAKRHEAVAP